MGRQAVMVTLLFVVLAGCGGESSNPNPQAISVVQSAGMSAPCLKSSGCNSQSLSLPKPVTTGDLLAAVLWWNQSNVSGSAVVTMTDSQNNRYTSIGPNINFNCGNSTLCYGFYAGNVAGGSNVTVQVSLTNSTGADFYMAVLEAKGAATFDFWKGGGCSVPIGCTAYSTDPFQLTHANELVVGVASLQPITGPISQFAIQAGPGFTEFYTKEYFAAEYLLATTPGQYQGVFMSNTPGVGQTIFAAFY